MCSELHLLHGEAVWGLTFKLLVIYPLPFIPCFGFGLFSSGIREGGASQDWEALALLSAILLAGVQQEPAHFPLRLIIFVI